MVAKEEEFKGSKILALFENENDERSVISFGLRKARIILAHVDDIKKFVGE